MGHKVHVLLGLILLYGIVLKNFNMYALFFNLSGFVLLYKYFKVWRFTMKFPGQFVPFNIKGFLTNSGENFHRDLRSLWEQHGRDKFIMWIGFERFIAVSDFKDIQDVLSRTDDASIMENYHQMFPWLGGNDVVKAYGFSPIALTSALMNGSYFQSDEFVSTINNRIGALCQQNFVGDAVADIQPVIRTITFDIVYGIATGHKPESREKFVAAEKLCQMADRKIYSGWKQYKWLANVLGEESKAAKCRTILGEHMRKALNERRADNSKITSSLLDTLAQDDRMSDEEVIATLIGFISLGYDRLASQLSLSLVKLSEQSSEQSTILRESQKEIASISMIKSMERTEKFLLEAQRLSPAVNVVTKWVTQGIPLRGYFIPPNSSVLTYLNGVDYNVKRFDNPEKFNTNRVNLTETFEGTGRDVGVSLPMIVMKVFLGNLVKRYQLRMEEDELKIGSGLTQRAKILRFNIKTR